MNPLMPQMAPQGPQGAPGNPLTAQPGPTDPADLAAFHGHADTYFNALSELAAKPQLSKEDVFKTVASLMGKGLFSDPKSQQALVMQLTQLPEDEKSLRQVIGQEMLHTAHIKDFVSQRLGNAGPSQ